MGVGGQRHAPAACRWKWPWPNLRKSARCTEIPRNRFPADTNRVTDHLQHRFFRPLWSQSLPLFPNHDPAEHRWSSARNREEKYKF